MDGAGNWLLLVFLICLALSAFFSSAESAFISLAKLRIRYLVESGVKVALFPFLNLVIIWLDMSFSWCEH